jgi:hypothetical protein
MNADEFYSSFEAGFSPKATAAGLTRSAGRALKWASQAADGHILRVGFRLNLENLRGYPGEFMLDIFWSGPRAGAGDTGEVSFYQYTLPREADDVASLQKRIIEKFIIDMELQTESWQTLDLWPGC